MAAGIYKWFLASLFAVFHPFYVSVMEIDHNAKDKTLEISCKIFTEDFESVLEKDYKQKVNLSDEKQKEVNDKLVKGYLFSHASIRVNGKPVTLVYVGFEKEKEAIWAYIQVNNVPGFKKVEVTNSILHDFNDGQINIIHVIKGEERKSTKLDYPKTEAFFNF